MKKFGRLFFSAPADIGGGSSAPSGGDTVAGSGGADGKSNATGADNQDVTGAAGDQPKNSGTGGAGETTVYTEADMQKLREEFNTRLTEETARAVDDALKKAGMKPEEKAAYEQEQKTKALEEREQQVALRELKADTASLLDQKQLPGEILDIVLGKD